MFFWEGVFFFWEVFFFGVERGGWGRCFFGGEEGVFFGRGVCVCGIFGGEWVVFFCVCVFWGGEGRGSGCVFFVCVFFGERGEGCSFLGGGGLGGGGCMFFFRRGGGVLEGCGIF